MSSSSSATGLNRSRSLRQPTAGLNKAQKQDEVKKDGPRLAVKGLDIRNKGAAASASASASTSADSRNMSPSRLPKPGASSIATRTRAGTATAGSSLPSPTASAIGTRSRPNSGIFGLGRSNTVAPRKPPVEEAGGPPRSARPTSTATRLARPKSMISTSKLTPVTSSRPSPTGTATSTSITSPAKPQSPRTTTHARAKSTATSSTTLTTLRPRPPSAGSVASTTTKPTTTTATGTNKRPLGRANMLAPRASHQRLAPADSLANTSTLSNISSSTTSATGTRPAKPTVTEDAPRLRPTFNTLQQHYSPARNIAPKPLTSSYLAPPTPSKLPANVALSSETAKLQTELLQLHLLHRDADAVTASWHASARERLGRRFSELAEANAEVGKEEAAVEEARNMAALKAWGGSGGGQGLEDKIQVLDEVLSGLWSLGESGGRYARAVRTFEKWVDQMTAAVKARRQAGGLGALMESGEVAFVGELDPAWRDEVSSLSRKLDGWRRQVAQLEAGFPEEAADEGQQRSSLARVLAGCRSQVRDMLAELDTMEEIERNAIAQEAAWIKRMNREETDDTPRAGAIWRAF